jgi:hypothetical protein
MRSARLHGLAIAAMIAMAAAGATPALAEQVRICDRRVDFPGAVRHFRLDEQDPFGASAVLTGALQQEGESFLLRFNCWRLASPRDGFPEERPALERLFRYTRALGIFNQTYVYLPAQDRLFIRVSGERTTNGTVYDIRFEFHMLRDRTLGAVTSYRRDSRAAREQADAFVDGLRSLR